MKYLDHKQNVQQEKELNPYSIVEGKNGLVNIKVSNNI